MPCAKDWSSYTCSLGKSTKECINCWRNLAPMRSQCLRPPLDNPSPPALTTCTCSLPPGMRKKACPDHALDCIMTPSNPLCVHTHMYTFNLKVQLYFELFLSSTPPPPPPKRGVKSRVKQQKCFVMYAKQAVGH